jgi:hypothetical protein
VPVPILNDRDLCFDSDFLLYNSCGSWCFRSWQGEPLCIFYSRYGICKFGPSCKFDHPMGVFTYNLTASSSADAPVRRLLGSSSGSPGLTLSSEGLVEAGPTKPRRLSLSEPRQMPPGDDNIDTGGWMMPVNESGAPRYRPVTFYNLMDD